MQSQEYPDLPFVRPRAWGIGRDGHSVRVIVVHYTAGSERSTSAEDGAAYDQRRTDGTSTHYFVDSDSVVQCVETWNRANAALHTGNRIGIQYELCGTQQTREQWLDAASNATITNAARQIARDCHKYGLPVRWLTPAQVRAGDIGICGHADITLAFPEDGGDHMDPGTAFPRDVLLARVNQFMNNNTPQEDDMAGHLDEAGHANRLLERGAALVSMSKKVKNMDTGAEVEDNLLAQTLLALVADVAVIKSRPAGTLVLTPEDKADLLAGFGAAAEAAVRRVLGAVDGSVPPGTG